jgi:hypothetical protein
LKNKVLITSGKDGAICIWSMKGQLIGYINLKYPLPFIWNVEIDE